jgi:DNA mismatch repair protein MSH6
MQLIFAKFDTKRTLWAAAAQTMALLDALGSLAQVASHAGFTRPKILECPPDGSPTIQVTQGKHPCVENTLGSSEFIPNDLSLGSAAEEGPKPRVLLLSGPNMGGKSTLLRQTCLISILAQIGSFVPAEACELTPIDRIYTRLGASDRLLLGQSTFFVEVRVSRGMSVFKSAKPLTSVLAFEQHDSWLKLLQHFRGATRRSLVIMDELGRGTSTFAIASATVKHFVERSQCLSLFATHYHSLLDEWKKDPSVVLGHM